MERDPRQGTGSQKPLRDWQRDTWYGPWPDQENPFDEPDDAPELRDLRSEELNNRSGEFWETQTGGYRYGRKPQPAGEPEQEPSKPKREKVRKGPVVLGALAAAVAAALLLNYAVFTVRTIRVEGNRQVAAEEIIRLSGLKTGTPLSAVNSAEVERAVEQNPLLKFRYLEKEYPSTLKLAVREREACCWMTWNGILYTMDKQRYVLYESEMLPESMSERKIAEDNPEEEQAVAEADYIEGTLVRVDGLKVRAGTVPGQRLALESAEQQEIFHALFLEMKVLDCTGLIQQADLSNPDSLLLTTRDGYTVSMGNAMNIHAKLRSMLLTREELIRRNERGGIINVSLPETPIYSPRGG